jgi:hypothetical protein
MERPTTSSKKTKEPPKRANHKGEHQAPKPRPCLVARSISNKERERPRERRPSLEQPSPTATNKQLSKTKRVGELEKRKGE